MFNVLKLFSYMNNVVLSKDDIAKILKVNPEVLQKFENAYKKTSLSEDCNHINAKSMAQEMSSKETYNSNQIVIINDIVNELLAATKIFEYKRNEPIMALSAIYNIPTKYITQTEIDMFPVDNKPELSGNLIKKDISQDSYISLITQLYNMQKATDPKIKMQYYHSFRQGLDILDLDAVTYEMLSMNKNNMSYWLPAMIPAIEKEGFFLIPNTRIAKVPITLLQLTRLDYLSHSRSTLDIINKWAQKAFELDSTKHYFIKTGTYSSKFDFRNAKVTEPQEVLEIGEYLLFIHSDAISMAQFDLSGRNRPIRYGVSTTNEWVVREFIEPEEDSDLTIYHGLPLHTEYRVFVDFDSNEVLGIHPYWDPKVMKNRFSNMEDSNNPDMIHDYITYSAQEEKLMKRYNENKDIIVKHIKSLISDVNLTGQWSIDIMQNGNKFWFIDMAIAENSAFYEETVPVSKRIHYEENWLPRLCLD